MEDGKPIELVSPARIVPERDETETRQMSHVTGKRKVDPVTSFKRQELDLILRIYGRMVALGEWRDYAIDHLANRALFSVYRRTSETPLYRIVKEPRLQRRQGAFSIETSNGLVLKRGRDLGQVLKVLEKKTLKLIQSAE